ncbi:ANTAR domain-containing response regulator [Endomicrobium proavitum]|uniref:Response regulator receiver and ANTAR domain protein n=1 Tax=Endomicrobium proavitum TaxID=1408281 RepID=A0A0G3WGE6_9BACT|nr:ANTAR domain-containing protein [Endomicrobium proavitum]AKL97746.1 response regulator receiver and ANTAR domain protein [Endomicrobium proavitum]
MDKAKILIASSDKSVLSLLKVQLETSLYNVLDGHSSGNEVIRKVNTLFPDLVISDYNLSDMTGLDLAKSVEDSRTCPIIVLANAAQSEYVEELKRDSLDIFCITKPVNAAVLNHMVALVLRLSRKMQEYESQVDSLKNQLEDRKIIDRAKGILMSKFNMSEDAAYKELRKKAMNASKTLGQIAKTIVDMFAAMD